MSNHSATFRLYDELMAKPKTKREIKYFALLPYYCPTKNIWFWMRMVYLKQELRYRLRSLSWGMGPVIEPVWVTMEVNNV